MSADLVAYLRARLDEEDAVARAAAPSPWKYPGIDSISGGMLYDESVAIAGIYWDNLGEKINPAIRKRVSEEQADATGRHIAHWDPARVLGDIAAKRAVLAIWEAEDSRRGESAEGEARAWLMDDVVLALVQSYAERDGFNPAWRAS